MKRNKLQFPRNEPDHPLSMQSYFRRKNCLGGNLLKIHTHQCTNGLCKAKLDGSSTKHNKTSMKCYNGTVYVNLMIFSNSSVLNCASLLRTIFRDISASAQTCTCAERKGLKRFESISFRILGFSINDILHCSMLAKVSAVSP